VATVDGLVSGLDTTTIVSQLMSLERAPQTRLKSSLSAQQADVTAYQAINTKMAALQTAADKVALAATWSQGTATSSSTAVTATAGTGAISGSVTFSVTALAAAGSRIGTQTYDSLTATPSTAVPSLSITGPASGTARTFSSKDGSLSSLVTEINAAKDLGVRAAAVQTSTGTWQLQLTAAGTGKANDFAVTGAAFATVSAATDAKLHVGDADAGYDITSASNTIEGVLPGVTLKATALATDVRVDVAQDSASLSSAVQALVDAANAALTTIGAQTKQGTVSPSGTTTGAGALAGDAGMRALAGKVLNAVTYAVGGSAAGSIGIQSTRDGALKFDAAKFGTALINDPDGTSALLRGTQVTTKDAGGVTTTTGADGIAVRLAAVAKTATLTGTGTLAVAIKSRTTSMDDLNKRIDAWDDRLAVRQKALQAQYAALEVALGKMKNQSTWLAGQLSALPTGSDS
jgi:flagellar hook-associated protein 2